MTAPPTIPPMDSSDGFNPEFTSISDPSRDGTAAASPRDETAPTSPEQRTAPHDAQTQQRVSEILHSDVGVSTLLNRLKASIASVRVSRVAAPPVHLQATPLTHTW